MNFIMRTAQPVTSHLPSVPEAEHHEEVQPTQKQGTTLEGLIAEDRFPNSPTGKDDGKDNDGASAVGAEAQDSENQVAFGNHTDVTEDEGCIIIPNMELPDNWSNASDVLQLQLLDRSFIFPGEQIHILVCLSASKQDTEIITPFRVAAVMSKNSKSSQNGNQQKKILGIKSSSASGEGDANGTHEETAHHGIKDDGETISTGNEMTPRRVISATKSFLRMEDHKQQTANLLERFRNSNFFVRVAQSGEPLWCKRNVAEQSLANSDVAGRSFQSIGGSLKTSTSLLNAVVDKGNFDGNTSGGLARDTVKCYSLCNGDIVVLLQVNVGISNIKDPVLEVLQFEKYQVTYSVSDNFNGSPVPNHEDPCNELLSWLLPLDRTLSPPRPLSPPLSSSVYQKTYSSPSAQIFSFSHLRTYSMPSLPQVSGPPSSAVPPSNSRPAFDLEDFDCFSPEKPIKSRDVGNMDLLSFRGVSLEPERFSVHCGLEGIYLPGRRWSKKLEIIQPLEICSFAAECVTEDLICVQIKNVAPAHIPDIIIFLDAITIVFGEVSIGGPSLSLPIASIETGNGHSLPNLVLRRGEEHSFILKPASTLNRDFRGDGETSSLQPHSKMSMTMPNMHMISRISERGRAPSSADQYAILVSCRCNYTESKLFFKQLTDWRPRIARDLTITVASESYQQAVRPNARAPQLPVQVLTLKATNLTSEDLTLTVLAPESSTSSPSILSLNSSPNTPMSPFIGFHECMERMSGDRCSISMHRQSSMPITIESQKVSDGGGIRSSSLEHRTGTVSDVISSDDSGCTHLWLQSAVPLGCVPAHSSTTVKLELLPLTDGIITLDTLQINVKEKVHSGSNLKRTDVTTVCIDLHERENARDSCIVDTPQTNLASVDGKTELDEFMASSASCEDNGHTCKDENEPVTLTRRDPLVTRASSLAVRSVGDEEFSDIPSDGTAVDVISDDEGSWISESESLSTTVSDVENEGYLEPPISDNCYATYEDMVDDGMTVIVFPDYVIYNNMLYGESRLTFFADFIKIECSDASGNENLVLECAIADIIYIHRQWSGSVEAALVKLCLRATDATRIEKPHKDGDVQIIFAVADMRWFEKEQKIKNLAERYGDIWNVIPDDDLEAEDDVLVPDMLFSRQFFTEVMEPFEDVIYPKGDPDAVSISKRDIDLLQPETFINDTIIDFYIKYLKNKLEPNEKHRFHFFNSFFFRKLADLDKDPGSASEGRAAFLRVHKWTRKVDIFAKDYIFIPVNFNLHWSLLVVCHPGELATFRDDDIKESSKVPCILHMDSIKGSHTGLKNIIQSYLWEEWKERHPESLEDNSSKFSNLRFVSLELPQQENSFDCGLFLLHYVELFLEEAPADFNPFKITKFSSFLGADWFSPVEASLKRTVIRKLIHDLLKDSSPKVTPATCSNGHLSSGFPEIDVDHEPIIEFLPEHSRADKPAVSDSIAPTGNENENDVLPVSVVEFLPQLCSPAKPAICDSLGPATDRGLQIELTCNVTQCDKQMGLVLQEFLEPGATGGSVPELQENSCQQDEPFQKLPSTAYLERVDTGMQVVSSSPDKDDSRPQGGSPNSQICLTSYSPKVVGTHGTSWSSMQEKEAIVTSLETFTMHDTVSDKNHEAVKLGSALPENSGYVSDSPSRSSGEKEDGRVEFSQETSTVKVKNKDHQDSQVIDTKKGDGADCKEVDSTEAKIGIGGACQEPSTTGTQDGDGGNYQELDASRADDGDGKECQKNDVIEAACLDGECRKVDATEAECGLHAGPCQEDLPAASSQDIITAEDECSLDGNNDGQPTAKRLEQQACKRRKIMPPIGGRMRTRSFTRDFPS